VLPLGPSAGAPAATDQDRQAREPAIRLIAVLETSNDYTRPRRPWPVRLLDAVDGLVPVAPRGFEEARLLEAARRKAKLDDFGDESFREPLQRLLASIRDEARLTSMGRIIQHARIVSLLANRLRIQRMLAAHPEILDVELGRVVVIAGLQRTGTTLLHRLLAADPSARTLPAWEALNPAPLSSRPGADRAARMRQAVRAERALAYLAPEFFAIHPIEATAPEEDVLLLELTFLSQAPEAMMYVPSYARWLEGQDVRPAYAYVRNVLQLLQWIRPGRHWVLKTPNHLEHLDALLETFPTALVVQTHRDPRKTIASFCSMVAHGRGVLSNHVDVRDVAAHWLRKQRRLVDRAMESRRSAPTDRFVDVAYADLVADPLAQVARIYRFAGLEFRDELRAAFEAARAANPPQRHGRHVYRLEDFGLTAEQVDRELAAYRACHKIPVEGTAA
jgi:hypothetical protein